MYQALIDLADILAERKGCAAGIIISIIMFTISLLFKEFYPWGLEMKKAACEMLTYANYFSIFAFVAFLLIDIMERINKSSC